MNYTQQFTFPIPAGWTKEDVEEFLKPEPFPFSMTRDEENGITRITYTYENGMSSSIDIPSEEEDRLVFCLEGGC